MVRALACALLLLSASPAAAGEIFAGAFVHDVATPLTLSGQEGGIDLQLGWRGERITALRAIGAPSPHAFVSFNTGGDTNFAVIGVGWTIGDRIYARPGIGLAIHDGPGQARATPDRIDFGSRILFAPELSIGTQIDARWSVEASWVHLSHAQIFGGHNPGSDNFGIRLNYRY